MNTAPIKGFRPLRVVAKVRESSIITSFHLEPENPDDWQPYVPGQFLVVRVAGVVRNYTLSGPQVPGRYRITVKREPPTSGFGPGASSGFLHDVAGVGDLIAAQGPRGEFQLNRASPRPVVLISGGVGLTPMVAMLHDLVVSDRRVLFLHGCENGDVHALRDEVLALTQTRPGITAHFCYRSPSDSDRATGRMQSEGVITKALLQQLLCLDDYDVYLCGPPPFMQAIYPILQELGVPEGRIAYEFFGPATVLKAAPPVAPLQPPKVATKGGITVSFRSSGLSAPWDEKAGSLLAFAEDQGLKPDFSCRAGICGTCVTRLLEGEVAYFEDPLDDVAPGQVLLCCARPVGPVVLDL